MPRQQVKIQRLLCVSAQQPSRGIVLRDREAICAPRQSKAGTREKPAQAPHKGPAVLCS